MREALKLHLVHIIPLIIFFFVPLLFSKSAFAGDIVINEIMYDLSGSDTDREWVEIYNKGSSAIDLSNWRFQEGATKHLLNSYQGGLIINANSYAVIVDKPETFLVDNPGLSGMIIDSSFDLKNDSEALKILESSDAIISSDEITYQSSWGAGGNGSSLERKNIFSSSNDPNNWQQSMNGGTPCNANSSGFIPSLSPTFAPSPTLKPTSTPKPTPTPTSTSTSTKSLTSSSSKSTNTPTPTVKSLISPTKTTININKEDSSSAILGESTNKNNLTPTVKTGKTEISPTISVKNSSSTNPIPTILIGLGVISLASCCGILAFKAYRKKLKDNQELDSI